MVFVIFAIYKQQQNRRGVVDDGAVVRWTRSCG